MPLAPRFIVKAISKRYIAGDTAESAVKTCRQLQERGFVTTLDILGESISHQDQAMAALDSYLALIDLVSTSNIEKNISLKPTALGLGLSQDLALGNIERIVQHAGEQGMFIRIDMEDSPYTDKTIQIYNTLRSRYANVGTVVQAYMRRSMEDVRSIAETGGNLRICKGIYKESEAIAFQDRQKIRDNYLALLKVMFAAGAYVGIATHDDVLIEGALQLIKSRQVSPDKYEFQALLGVPIETRLEQLINAGHKVRIYVPFGSDWYAYSSRRLKENPDLAGYIVKNLFKSG